MMYYYDLHQRTMFGYRKVASNILPTPALMDATYPPSDVDAYEWEPAKDGHPAIWRLRDDGFDKPGTVYTRVTATTKHEDDD